jgi:hypothetical protein
MRDVWAARLRNGGITTPTLVIPSDVLSSLAAPVRCPAPGRCVVGADSKRLGVGGGVRLQRRDFQNERPQSPNLEVTATAGQVAPIPLPPADGEGDAVIYRALDAGVLGQLDLDRLTYTPTAAFGSETVSYVAFDGVDESVPGTLEFTIKPAPTGGGAAGGAGAAGGEGVAGGGGTGGGGPGGGGLSGGGAAGGVGPAGGDATGGGTAPVDLPPVVFVPSCGCGLAQDGWLAFAAALLLRRRSRPRP